MKQSGLSLMELMIALVIVAIIAGVAYPGYQKLVTRSKQTEVKTMLKAIYMGQDLYRTIHQQYAKNLTDLDIDIPTDITYQYSISVNETGDTWEAKATANIDSDPAIDEWVINQANQMENRVNDVIE